MHFHYQSFRQDCHHILIGFPNAEDEREAISPGFEVPQTRNSIMILNIVDNRKLRYRWKRINAVAEPTWHDNKCKDADQAEVTQDERDYEERNNISVTEAIKWADNLSFPVTLYLYDCI
jgi:hypothetical protein